MSLKLTHSRRQGLLAAFAVAVSDAAFAQLKALVPDAVRVGGKDRYETSRLIAEYGITGAKVFPAGSTANAFLATGAAFPDALSAGAVAGLPGVAAPVVLVPGTASTIPVETVTLLNKLGTTKATVVGGTGAVSQALFASIPAKYAPVRISGADRYETSAAIVTAVRVPLTASGPLAVAGVLATGANFPDALAGAAYAAASGATLWVVPPTCVPTAVLATASALKLGHWALLGGEGVLARPAIDNLTVCT